MLFAIFLSFFFGYYSYYTGMGELPLPSIYVGEVLMITGEAFRLWGVFTLGKYFSPIVTIYSDHRVVDKGPYKLVGHPAYGGAIITILGVSIALRSIFSLISVLIIAQIYNYRANLEERLLIKNLGEEYEEYKRRVRRKFVPYLL